MSVDIYIATPTTFHVTPMNMANTNAADLFRWLGLNVGLWGGDKIPARTLYRACDTRLKVGNPLVAAVVGTFDGGYEPSSAGRIIYGGRRPGYLRERAEELRDICEQALDLHPESTIYWG